MNNGKKTESAIAYFDKMRIKMETHSKDCYCNGASRLQLQFGFDSEPGLVFSFQISQQSMIDELIDQLQLFRGELSE